MFLNSRWQTEIKSVRVLVVAFLVMIAHHSTAQKLDSIYYIIPASVKTKILDQIKESKPDVGYYIVLSHQNDTTSILITRYDNHPEELSRLVKNTNRFIRLNSSRVIPVVWHSDFLFSSLLHSVKNENAEYAAYKHKLINPSGFLIEYYGRDEKAKIVRAEFYQN